MFSLPSMRVSLAVMLASFPARTLAEVRWAVFPALILTSPVKPAMFVPACVRAELSRSVLRPGAPAAQHVAPGQGVGQGRALDGEGVGEAAGVEVGDEVGIHAQGGEGRRRGRGRGGGRRGGGVRPAGGGVRPAGGCEGAKVRGCEGITVRRYAGSVIL